jgi:hypothetical protein
MRATAAKIRLAESSKAIKVSCCKIKLVKERNRFRVDEALHDRMCSALTVRQATTRNFLSFEKSAAFDEVPASDDSLSR